MRLIIIVLALFICFLLGVVYGSDRDNNEYIKPEFSYGTGEQIEIERSQYPQDVSEDMMVGADNTPIYKTASALQTVVDFFYDVIVEILYQLSRLFI